MRTTMHLFHYFRNVMHAHGSLAAKQEGVSAFCGPVLLDDVGMAGGITAQRVAETMSRNAVNSA